MRPSLRKHAVGQKDQSLTRDPDAQEPPEQVRGRMMIEVAFDRRLHFPRPLAARNPLDQLEVEVKVGGIPSADCFGRPLRMRIKGVPKHRLGIHLRPATEILTHGVAETERLIANVSGHLAARLPCKSACHWSISKIAAVCAVSHPDIDWSLRKRSRLSDQL